MKITYCPFKQKKTQPLHISICCVGVPGHGCLDVLLSSLSSYLPTTVARQC